MKPFGDFVQKIKKYKTKSPEGTQFKIAFPFPHESFYTKLSLDENDEIKTKKRFRKKISSIFFTITFILSDD